ncbi:class D beta-lactamase [Metabacillus iocasae]
MIGIVTLGMYVESPRLAKAKKNDQHVMKVEVEEEFAGYNGTFVLRDVKKGKTFVYNEERANKRTAPESTFKIPNALIGLQVGAVDDEYEIKEWDGVEREIPVWNQDHTLGSGMRNSVVWYYQEMARDIGEATMKEWIEKLSYGNEDLSGGIDQFWLSRSLKISPVEEVDFIEQLSNETLPFDLDVMRTVKRMMVQAEGKDYTLYGKTGQGSGIGWYVGYLDVNGKTYVFATNIDGTSADAKRITRNILTKNGFMNE